MVLENQPNEEVVEVPEQPQPKPEEKELEPKEPEYKETQREISQLDKVIAKKRAQIAQLDALSMTAEVASEIRSLRAEQNRLLKRQDVILEEIEAYQEGQESPEETEPRPRKRTRLQEFREREAREGQETKYARGFIVSSGYDPNTAEFTGCLTQSNPVEAVLQKIAEKRLGATKVQEGDMETMVEERAEVKQQKWLEDNRNRMNPPGGGPSAGGANLTAEQRGMAERLGLSDKDYAEGLKK